MAATFEEFFAALPREQREALERLRAQIHAAVPGLTEAISYGVPAFKHNGKPFVSVGAAMHHLAFYVQSPAAMDRLALELSEYETSKGTIRFRADAPLPDELVRKVLAARLADFA